MRRSTLACGLLVLALAFAGCLKEATIRPREYYAYGQQGSFAVGYAYDARGVLAFNGNVTIFANDEANEGRLVAQGFLSGERWNITFDRFSEEAGKPFQDGGIASSLAEHGSTGVGDTSFPHVDVEVAAWGTARLQVEGRDVPDPVSGDARWMAHYMVVKNGIRDDASGRIVKADGVTAYDPAKPDEARSTVNDTEILLTLKSKKAANAAPQVKHVESGPINTATWQRTHDLFEAQPPGTHATFYFNLTNGNALSDLDFIVSDATGRVLTTSYLGGAQNGRQSDVVGVTLLNASSPVHVDVMGKAVGSSYSVDVVLRAPAQVVLNFWWEEVVRGDAARRYVA